MNKHNEALIENLAYYDQLTKLPNRRSLIRDCELRISNATTSESEYLMFFNIDGFKAVNDNYGHDAGEVRCNTSIGVACYREDGDTTQTLLQIADKAMYQVKKAGGGGLCFGYEIVE